MSPPPHPKPRLLIFVIAYYAETTLQSVLERIPRDGLDVYDWEVLVVDDASDDRTFAIGREYQRSYPEIAMTVLRNEYNQGYGGNQKVGYAYAVANKFDFVAMVHGDGQYAPEELPRLLEPLLKGEADAVFGSRMLDRFGALKGGMPLYKYVGNKVLTAVQNGMLGTRLSEFHSGYRIYSVRMLERIQYRLNSNDFHFDTEIIIQLFNIGARIVELPIPTFYGDEVCRVDGMKYAKDVLHATLQNVAHRSGLLHQRRLDPRHGEVQFDLKLGYASSHTYALDAVRPGSKVLEVGSEAAELAGELRRKDCEVTIVDREAGKRAPAGVRVIEQDLDDPPEFDSGPHEYVLMLDIIEHLHDPERFLEQLRKAVRSHAEKAHLDAAERRLRHPAPDAPRGSVQLRESRHPRPHAHAPLHVPVDSLPAARRGLPDQDRERRAGAVPEGPWVGASRSRSGGRERRAHRPEQDAVLVPDLHRGREHARRRLPRRRRAGAQRPRHDGRDVARSRRREAPCEPRSESSSLTVATRE